MRKSSVWPWRWMRSRKAATSSTRARASMNWRSTSGVVMWWEGSEAAWGECDGGRRGLHDGAGGAGFGAVAHGDEVAHRHEAEAFGEETVEGTGHGIDAGGMDIVDEDDAAGSGIGEDAAAGHGSAAGAPVFGVHAPEDRGVAEFVHDPLFLAGGDGTVGWAVHARGGSEADEGAVAAFQFIADRGVAQAAEFRVGPRVIGEFVAIGDDAAHDGWVAGGILTDGEEGGPDAAGFEHIEESRGIGGVGAVVEGHGDVGAGDRDAVVADAGAGRQASGGRVELLAGGGAGHACGGVLAAALGFAGTGGQEGEQGGAEEEKGRFHHGEQCIMPGGWRSVKCEADGVPCSGVAEGRAEGGGELGVFAWEDRAEVADERVVGDACGDWW